ncbi:MULTISPECIES: NHL domain-containing thioredoxin family protein [unclassified Arthrobacter]|uniref:NHL domain-containing thioredoxin family protein n=1 Tax=unclassified Arthrobacter TaxID=235627 RepID=UPI001D14F076|nr:MULTISPECIES: NHL domain-containing thioredoxin family protein [unclassified Arthrobacter]MCC3289992.1 NHL domain-containing thioredoxin family protein [Arthrobacter sp. zg-Y1110]MCC3300496.1 NHL domain-containing thioredoxin family protein [Arthrobacter sp. zg-Y895]UWX84606.1 NHL domain-containing thioredoxin family protein [Arthrobacter sp. zg-Y1110]
MTETVRAGYRVRASELEGRNWLNTGGRQLNLEDLRGKIVLLDFWTFCCINCLHVLDELRPLEEKFSDVLVTVGVHSPKFEHEADPVALAAAVERYEIHHPVLDDPELLTWQAYTARAWPTLVVLDPEGYIVAHLSGEGHAAGLESLVAELVEEHEAKGTLHRGDGPYVPAEPTAGDLRFPGKVTALPGGTFLVADTGHHRLVELEADLTGVRRTIGDGTKGWQDGDAGTARFNEPQGVALLPADVAEKAGYDVVVADTVNHRLRSVNLATGAVQTIAGNGVQRLLDAGNQTKAGAASAGSGEAAAGDNAPSDSSDLLGAEPLNISLSSPWDLVWSSKLQRLVIAMAGTHQIFSFDPETGAVAVLAGTGLEGLLDGGASAAWFAQSSGLAEDSDGNLWVADSETSALRKLFLDGTGIQVETAVGTGLFDFGFRDGAASQARLQHPLGVAVLPDGSVAVADTYNGAVRRYDPVTGTVSTLARGLSEPSDVLVDNSAAEPLLIVVESNRHQLVRLPIPKEAQSVDEGARQTQRPKTPVEAGPMSLTVRFAAPKGQKLDDRWGDPTQLKISASPEELLVSGGGTATGLTRDLVLSDKVTDGVLHITARAAACDGEPGGEIPDHAACHMYQQDWGIPVVLQAGGESELVLDLRGLD